MTKVQHEAAPEKVAQFQEFWLSVSLGESARSTIGQYSALCTALYLPALHCTVITALYCTAMHCPSIYNAIEHSPLFGSLCTIQFRVAIL